MLRGRSLDPATRQAAATLRDNLGEQQRLEPFLQDAVQSGAVTALQRALGDAPDKRPGHYKVTTNAIKGLPLTPAESVAGTFRALLSQVLPQVPEGLPRGLLLYIAANMIHGFADGNGRLSRFLLAWETEAAGLSPIVIPLDVRTQASRALDVAWLEGELQPPLEALRLAYAETGRLLRELEASPPFSQ